MVTEQGIKYCKQYDTVPSTARIVSNKRGYYGVTAQGLKKMMDFMQQKKNTDDKWTKIPEELQAERKGTDDN